MLVYHEIKPFYDEFSEILILGSMPSVKSRELGFYYMHPSNRFWQVLEKVYEEKITDKKEFLKKHHIALWDVISSCEIESSKDSTIKQVKVNDIKKILKVSPIKMIITTGSKASTLYLKYIYPKTNIKNISLPSTSSANAQYSLDDLVKLYSIIREK